MATEKWASAESRSTGITAATLAAGANVLGSEIDNAVNLDRYASIEVEWACDPQATAGTVIEVYLMYDLTGDNSFEVDTPDPVKTPVGIVSARAGTSAQRVIIDNIPLAPFAFKILLKSELSVEMQSVNVLCSTYNLSSV